MTRPPTPLNNIKYPHEGSWGYFTHKKEGGRGLLFPFRHGKDGYPPRLAFYTGQKKNALADTPFFRRTKHQNSPQGAVLQMNKSPGYASPLRPPSHADIRHNGSRRLRSAIR